MTRKRRKLSNAAIRALAYEVAADEIESGTGISEIPLRAIDEADGSDADLAALETQIQRITERLRQRACAIRDAAFESKR